ncbi:hypothetical protein QVD17_03326 [Tagetes erecta]|uniref:Uncharacterized protein n=1 Tax=Tagetes erecta TaxID=13708 RepID=A0AAD8LFI6_TARER|nr:hypothetical protein QVD17_03326 [Tagetes erecta]
MSSSAHVRTQRRPSKHPGQHFFVYSFYTKKITKSQPKSFLQVSLFSPNFIHFSRYELMIMCLNRSFVLLITVKA